ncbi:hypothetical protein [Cupriavidus basilensis]|uniref:hypothetical protein n=1 Tax=Cupriavidus basilensis TaxID=68895 RepID=UPI0020A63331|nr:hypothetical protein [Cupriavidus basilensis]MCP3018267.1 hypothetical protein [Cupriavidus basilensis]
MPTSPYSFHRIAATLLVLATAGGVHAEEDKSITRQLIEADGKVALKKLNQDLAGNAPPPAVPAAPAGAAEAKARERSPQTIALYGIDGTSAGGAVNLRSYVRWGEQVYPARVGAKWRGYTVSSISEAGTTFSRGKTKVFAPLVQDDAAVLFDTPRDSAAAGGQVRPAGPLPAPAGASISGFPVASPPVTPPAMPPIVPPTPGVGAASVAQS